MSIQSETSLHTKQNCGQPNQFPIMCLTNDSQHWTDYHHLPTAHQHMTSPPLPAKSQQPPPRMQEQINKLIFTRLSGYYYSKGKSSTKARHTHVAIISLGPCYSLPPPANRSYLLLCYWMCQHNVSVKVQESGLVTCQESDLHPAQTTQITVHQRGHKTAS